MQDGWPEVIGHPTEPVEQLVVGGCAQATCVIRGYLYTRMGRSARPGSTLRNQPGPRLESAPLAANLTPGCATSWCHRPLYMHALILTLAGSADGPVVGTLNWGRRRARGQLPL